MRRVQAVRLAILGYGISVALLVVIGSVLHFATTREHEFGHEVGRALEVLEGIARINAAVAQAESAQRGHFLYGPGPFLEQRDAAVANLRAEFAQLQRLTGGSTAQDDRVAELGRLIEMRVARMLQNLANREEALARGVPPPTPGRGQALTRKIAQLTDSLRETQLAILQARRDIEAQGFTAVQWLLAVAALILAAGILPAYVGFIRTARAHERLGTRMNDLVESLPGAVFQARAWPDGRIKYELLSSSTRHVRQVDPEEALRDANVVTDSVVEADRAMFRAAVARGMQTLRPIQMDYRIKAFDGSVRWIRALSAPSPQRDGSTVWSGHWGDVTSQKELEVGLLRAMEDAYAADRAKSRFLATMSHEIRTPMNGMLGMLELLSMTPLDDAQLAKVGIVRDSGRALLRIIDDILDFSRIEADKLELHVEPGSIADTVKCVSAIQGSAASGKGLVLTSHVDSRIAPLLRFDSIRLQQILNNLMNNAIKFTSHGSVTLEARHIEDRGERQIVAFEVRDTGIGMTQAQRDRLFEPFSQAAPEISSRYGGTGLGLSICRRLAGLMQGTIELHSTHGSGTRAVLTLPFERATGAAATSPPGAPVAANPSLARGAHRVLVVDDHPVNRMVLLDQMSVLGFQASSADDGRDALEKWQVGRFDAIVTDCNMPEMNGFELARHIREAEARDGVPRIPIIACTANALAGEREKCLAAGMDDYIAKPVELSQLAAKLRPLLPSEPEAAAGGAAPWREILARFRVHNDEDVATLRMAFERRDGTAVMSACHRIKGAARTIGADAFAGACDVIEDYARAGDWDAIAQTMESFDRELTRLDEHINSTQAKPND